MYPIWMWLRFFPGCCCFVRSAVDESLVGGTVVCGITYIIVHKTLLKVYYILALQKKNNWWHIEVGRAVWSWRCERYRWRYHVVKGVVYIYFSFNNFYVNFFWSLSPSLLTVCGDKTSQGKNICLFTTNQHYCFVAVIRDSCLSALFKARRASLINFKINKHFFVDSKQFWRLSKENQIFTLLKWKGNQESDSSSGGWVGLLVFYLNLNVR